MEDDRMNKGKRKGFTREKHEKGYESRSRNNFCERCGQ